MLVFTDMHDKICVLNTDIAWVCSTWNLVPDEEDMHEFVIPALFGNVTYHQHLVAGSKVCDVTYCNL